MVSRARLWTFSIVCLALSLLSSPSHAQLRPRQATAQPEKARRAAAVDSLEGMGRKQRRNGTATPAVVCGDGIISGGEQCDDGNLLEGDGCDRTCTIPPQPANLKLQGRPARFHCVVYGANANGRRVEVCGPN